jgi:two-component system chemotaxis response regulator CheB
MVFRAAESGALAFVREPAGFSAPEHARQAAELRLTIKTMAQVRVVKRWLSLIRRPAAGIPAPRELPAPGKIGLVAIGASTGGPVAIKAILSRLPAGLSAPIVIVQHISPGFVEGFAQWLDGATPLKVSVAAHGETALPGHVYVAPDGRHLTVGSGPVMLLVDAEPDNGLRPSVSRLFRSVAATYGKDSVGVLLTGMGEDGAAELKTMRDAGAVTIAQDSESALINGMPGAAVRDGAASYVLSPEGIAAAIAAMAPAEILGGRL